MKLLHSSFLLTIAAATCLTSQSSFAEDKLTDSQVTQVKGVVHDYLVTNPQVLVEASQSLQKQEMAKMQQTAQNAIVQNANKLFADPATPVAGNAKGNVTVIEFFDYQCPHCKDMKPVVEKMLAANSNVRVAYKELPIFGQSSRDASAAALAANKQGADKYLKLHNALLGAANPLTQDKIMDIAKKAGLNTDQLAKDMKDSAVQKQIDDNLQLAQALNLIGTPTFVISKWQVGAAKNDVKKAAFVPGMPSADELQKLVTDAAK